MMAWVDFAVLIIIALSCVISVVRGFVKEAVSLVSWALAFVLAISLADNLALLITSIEDAGIRVAVAFAILFVATLLVGGLAGFMLGTFIEKTGLTGTDRSLGALFGLLRGVIVICGLVIVGGMTRIPQAQWWQDSLLLPYFVGMVKWLVRYVPENLANYIIL